jgi:phosphatidylinositol alpha-mannosyltransferase
VYETVAGSGTKVQVAGTAGRSAGGTSRPNARGTTGGIR